MAASTDILYWLLQTNNSPRRLHPPLAGTDKAGIMIARIYTHPPPYRTIHASIKKLCTAVLYRLYHLYVHSVTAFFAWKSFLPPTRTTVLQDNTDQTSELLAPYTV